MPAQLTPEQWAAKLRGSYDTGEIARAIRDAVAAERRRCCRIVGGAETWIGEVWAKAIVHEIESQPVADC